MENSSAVEKQFALMETGFLDHKGQEIYGLVIVIIIMIMLLLPLPLPLLLMLMLILGFFFL